MAKKLLLIDDDPAFREMVGIALRQRMPDLEIDEARDGHLGEKKLRGARYDLILLDYKLPFGMDGLRFLEKTEKLRLDTPLIMITGEGNEDTAARAFRLGVTDYLGKRRDLLLKLQSLVEEVLAEKREQPGESRGAHAKRANLNSAISSVEFIRNYRDGIPPTEAGSGQMADAVMIEFEDADEFNKFSSFVKRIDGVKIQDVRILDNRFIYMLSLLPSRFEKMGKVFTTA